MKNFNSFFLMLAAIFCTHPINAQQQVLSINKCGGADQLTIPTIIDNDNDGMDDRLEQKLVEKFAPSFMQFSGDNCPGPAVNGTGDTNLVVCRIFPLPQQYARTNSLDSVMVKPVAVIPKRGLKVGLVWYNTTIIINGALLYGKDCGLNGHTADVEGFTISLKYIGSDSLAGWRYDTIMQNWIGGVIQTFSHAGTICEKIETKPYKSVANPNGTDSIFASPSKHGNYLTINGCNASFICDPGCSGTQQKKKTRIINIGEENAPLVSNLGVYYAGYQGEDPWSTNKFLAAQGGNAGAIKDKMLRKVRSEFVQGISITNQSQICALYLGCFGPPSTTIKAALCDGGNYFFKGQQLSQSGIYRDTVLSTSGCDSFVTLNLGVGTSSQYTYSDSGCGSYSFNGKQLTKSGNYRDTIQNSAGCDSVISLQLSLKPVSQSLKTATICYDSFYVFNGRIITTQGAYYDTLSNTVGCDSIVALQLTVNNPNVSWSNVPDTTYTQGNIQILVGGTPFGGNYWGVGVSGNYFYPNIAGNGYHSVTYFFEDTTGCSGSITKVFVVGFSNINDATSSVRLQVYPNPVKETLTVVLESESNLPTTMFVTDITGKKITEKRYDESVIMEVDCITFSPGIYIIHLERKGEIFHQFFVK